MALGLQERRQEWAGALHGQLGTGRGGAAHTWQHSEEGASEAVAHGVGTQADVHACVILAGPCDEQFVEVGAIGPGPHVTCGQHHELLSAHVDGGVVAALGPVFNSLQPLDHWLNITPHFALERCGATKIDRRVHRVRACEDRLRACPLCNVG